MQNYKQEVIKVVMMNFLDNISPKNSAKLKYIKPLDSIYLDELNIDKNFYDAHDYNLFPNRRKLNFEELIELTSIFNTDAITIKAILNIKNKSLVGNPLELIMFCTAYLNLYPLTCEALIEKSQNELKIGSMKAAFNSMDGWNKSQETIYSSIYAKYDTPTIIYHLNEKFNIFRYEDNFYLVPIGNNYYGLRLILGKVFLIPDNYIVNIVRFLKKIFVSRYAIIFFLKFINNNLSHKKTIPNMHSNNLLIILFNPIIRLLKKSSLLICQYSMGLITPKSYSSFNDAKNAANL